ncbi:glucose 1-dehydrogenase [Papillibacter cinnamivorans]|uniref:3-oxoacyl-[acyl-carrier protein] reductase n=1 Tax=Papillibacter cinnamivorans DSM 12816 TaxID=1122930 RepID=A0A1W2CVX8_9FIRM|nr:glucose 1-dehydrogenase [Papillibacter cinnamivorans]SMC88878.1 3-oxoacyl-[acyl-carrier protein] reductase [Papillibacter cinnamivorans DSM 12816]
MEALIGKAAIVTGASRGIGKAIAEHLAASGAAVTVNYSRSPDEAMKVVEEIRGKGGRAEAVRADVSTVGGIRALFDGCISAFGRVDILVNNAGIAAHKPITEVTEEEFDRVVALNVKGLYFSCREAMLRMESGGRIINISSSVDLQMIPTYSVYAGTKGAVEQFTRHLAKEFAPRNITINAVAPGPVATELLLSTRTPEQRAVMCQNIAFGRLGEPEDIADAIDLLVSEKSHWITGQNIRVNGGLV